MIGKCRQYSIPLILGIICSLIWANLSAESYHHIVHTEFLGKISFHWLVNDVYMALFFAIAGVEIVNSFSLGGSLSPIKKAMTPLIATAGGVLGPVGVFFILNAVIGSSEYINGWGICTATDIALAWLVAKIVFGKNHPAVSFLILLAVADDAAGLLIIAIFYPDPLQPTQPIWLALVLVGMTIAYIFNKKGIKNYWAYLLICGTTSWFAMYNAHLHPALALIFIIPFIPRTGIAEHHENIHGLDDAMGPSTLQKFEHQISLVVDFGLFFFGFTNAGVEFAEMSSLTLIIFLALVIGKTLGVSLFTMIAIRLGFNLPDGMQAKDVIIAGIIAGMGLTVALFVADSAFADLSLQGAAKMGALFTVFVGIFAIVLGKIVGVKKAN